MLLFCFTVSCGIPSVVNGSVTLDKAPDGTLLNDTATVTCDEWYQTRRNNIICQVSGEWERTTCKGFVKTFSVHLLTSVELY